MAADAVLDHRGHPPFVPVHGPRELGLRVRPASDRGTRTTPVRPGTACLAVHGCDDRPKTLLNELTLLHLEREGRREGQTVVVARRSSQTESDVALTYDRATVIAAAQILISRRDPVGASDGTPTC